MQIKKKRKRKLYICFDRRLVVYTENYYCNKIENNEKYFIKF